MFPTVDTLAVPLRKEIADEETTGDRQIPSTYVRSKRAAERVVEEGIQQGLHASIIHPGFMLGPWDSESEQRSDADSPSQEFLDAGDSDWRLQRMRRARCCDGSYLCPGSRHSGSALYFGCRIFYWDFDLWCRIATVVRPPKTDFHTSHPLANSGWTRGGYHQSHSGQESDFNSASIRTTAQLHWYSSQRAKNELDYHNRPIDETLRDAADWLKGNGYF